MILPFKKEINSGLSTNFESKIWAGLIANKLSTREEFLFYSDNCKKFPMYDDYFEKIHTIRESGRWKIGNKIHFATGVRTKKYYQFAPILKVISVQKIEIKHYGRAFANVYINGKFIDLTKLEYFVRYDGFNSTYHFFNWFAKDFEGEIIHWTNFKY